MEPTKEDKKKSYNQTYYQKNRLRLLENNKNYRKTHEDSIKLGKSINYQNNSEHFKNISREYRNIHKEELSKKSKEYRKTKAIDIKKRKNIYYRENVTQIKKKNSIYQKFRTANDPIFRMLCSLRTRIRNAYKAQGSCKNNQTLDLLGCDKEYLKTYLEDKFKIGMTHENYGYTGWHIDHIIPLSSAGNDLEKLKGLCHYTNLQPLWWWENLEKSDKLDYVGNNDK